MGLGDFLFGSKSKTKKRSLLTPEQEEALQSYFSNPIEQSDLYKQGQGYLSSILQGGPEAFSAFEAPYIQQFNQQTIPQLAEQFAGVGGLSSSAFGNQLASAGSNLQNQLATLHSGLKMQALPQALQYAQQPYANKLAGLGVRAFENQEQPATGGVLGGFLPSLATAAGTALGGPLAGALTGAVTSMFKGGAGR